MYKIEQIDVDIDGQLSANLSETLTELPSSLILDTSYVARPVFLEDAVPRFIGHGAKCLAKGDFEAGERG